MEVSSSLLSNSGTEREGPEQSRWNKFMGHCLQCWSYAKDCYRASVQGAKDCWAWCKRSFWAIISCCGLSFWAIIGCCGLGSVLKACYNPCLPLSKKWALHKRALADLLDSVATLSVMGILTLNIFCATFFVSWAPKSIDCLPKIAVTDDTKSEVTDDTMSEVEKWVKVIIVGLPFTWFPVTLYIAGQAKALQRDIRGLGLVSGGVLLELIYMLCIGTMMMVCTSGSNFILAAKVTGSLIAFVLVGCGCCCYYPEWLRSVLRCFCCWGCTCQEIDIEAPAPTLAPADQTLEAPPHAHMN